MKIILLDPAPKNYIQPPYEHLGLGYLASMLRHQKGWNVQLLSCNIENLSLRKIVNRILSDKPDLLGISVKSVHAKRVFQIVDRLRAQGFHEHITIGGHFPTFHHQQTLHDFPQIDSVVRGEGEYTIIELVEKLTDNNFYQILGISYRQKEEIKINPPRNLISNLDQLPFPTRDHTTQILKRGGVITISASRGCYANCAFCSIANFYKLSPGRKWRCRSPENVVDEIELLENRFGTTYFKFIDDQLFTSNNNEKEYIDKLRQELNCRHLNIKFAMNCRANHIDYELFRMLKYMGLKKVFVGIESAHQRGLNTFQKGTTVELNNRALKILDRLDIDYDIGFILIDPYTTYQELCENLQYLSDIKPRLKGRKCYLSVSTSLKIYEGTPIFSQLQKENRLKGNYIQGYNYHVEDDQVRRFQFIMAFIIEQHLLHLYYYLLYLRQLLNINKLLKFINKEVMEMSKLKNLLKSFTFIKLFKSFKFLRLFKYIISIFSFLSVVKTIPTVTI